MMARVILLCVGASGCNEVRMAGVRDEVDGREERGENCSPPHCDGGGVSLVGPREWLWVELVQTLHCLDGDMLTVTHVAVYRRLLGPTQL